MCGKCWRLSDLPEKLSNGGYGLVSWMVRMCKSMNTFEITILADCEYLRSYFAYVVIGSIIFSIILSSVYVLVIVFLPPSIAIVTLGRDFVVKRAELKFDAMSIWGNHLVGISHPHTSFQYQLFR